MSDSGGGSRPARRTRPVARVDGEDRAQLRARAVAAADDEERAAEHRAGGVARSASAAARAPHAARARGRTRRRSCERAGPGRAAGDEHAPADRGDGGVARRACGSRATTRAGAPGRHATIVSSGRRRRSRRRCMRCRRRSRPRRRMPGAAVVPRCGRRADRDDPVARGPAVAAAEEVGRAAEGRRRGVVHGGRQPAARPSRDPPRLTARTSATETSAALSPPIARAPAPARVVAGSCTGAGRRPAGAARTWSGAGAARRSRRAVPVCRHGSRRRAVRTCRRSPPARPGRRWRSGGRGTCIRCPAFPPEWFLNVGPRAPVGVAYHRRRAVARPLVLGPSPRRRRPLDRRARRRVLPAWQSAGSAYSNNFSLGDTGSQRRHRSAQEPLPGAVGRPRPDRRSAPTSGVDEPGGARADRADARRGLRAAARQPGRQPVQPGGTRRRSRADGKIAFATVVFDERADLLPLSAIKKVVSTAQAPRAAGLQVELGGQAIQQTRGRAAGLADRHRRARGGRRPADQLRLVPRDGPADRHRAVRPRHRRRR